MVMHALATSYRAARGICETQPLDLDLWDYRRNTIVVKVARTPQLAEKGSAAYLEGRDLKTPVLIVNIGDGQFAAYRNRCTHMLHRKLDPVPGQDRLRCCSIGHSTFDLEGNRISGFARRPITRYKTELKEGRLTVTL